MKPQCEKVLGLKQPFNVILNSAIYTSLKKTRIFRTFGFSRGKLLGNYP